MNRGNSSSSSSSRSNRSTRAARTYSYPLIDDVEWEYAVDGGLPYTRPRIRQQHSEPISAEGAVGLK